MHLVLYKLLKLYKVDLKNETRNFLNTGNYVNVIGKFQGFFTFDFYMTRIGVLRILNNSASNLPVFIVTASCFSVAYQRLAIRLK